MRVIIDGIEYVPATEAIANIDAVLSTLMEDYWGDDWTKADVDATYITVTEDDGLPMGEFVARLARKLGEESQ